IVEKLDTTNTFGYGFYLQGSKLKLVMANGGAPVTFLSTDVIPNSAWHHVTVTVRRTKLAAIEGKFYINGVADSGGPFTPVQGNINNIASLRLGRLEIGLDEVEIFNRPLTPAEVKAIRDA